MTEDSIAKPNVERAVEIANKLREHEGIDTIDDLPKGVPADGAHCPLAQAFNFECAVVPIYNLSGTRDEWEVVFKEEHKEKAEYLAELLGEEVREVLSTSGAVRNYRVNLPKEVGVIAWTIDNHLSIELSEKYSMTPQEATAYYEHYHDKHQ